MRHKLEAPTLKPDWSELRFCPSWKWSANDPVLGPKDRPVLQKTARRKDFCAHYESAIIELSDSHWGKQSGG
jgi:hypothetical protein